VYTTPTFRALDYRFQVAVDDADFGAYVASLFASLPVTDEPGTRWVVQPDDGEWQLTIDGQPNGSAAGIGALTGEIVRALNALAIGSWEGVVCHAGGVSRDGAGFVFPADMEQGKTTLTTGLVRAGFRYLTDEGVAFRPGTAEIEPYAKPMSIDPGSWHLFPELEPRVDLAADDYKKDQWQVPPASVRPDAAGGVCVARGIVFPQYQGGEHTMLEPIGRAEALVELAKNTFNFRTRGREALEALAVVVRDVDCYRMTVGDLDTACALVDELAATLTGVGADDE
jgi:hypothetical protein